MNTRLTKKQTELNLLAREVYTLNKEMNEVKRKHDAARKSLFAKMQDNGLTSFEAEVYIHDNVMTLEAAIESKLRTEIDVKKLARSVELNVLLECVTASVSTVERVAGSAVAARCSIEGRTAENVNVKAAK